MKAANNRIHLVLCVVGIVKGLNELALSSGYHLWLHTDFSFMTINTIIEIMHLSFRRSKQTSASQENFLEKEHSRARGICIVTCKSSQTLLYCGQFNYRWSLKYFRFLGRQGFSCRILFIKRKARKWPQLNFRF